MEKINKPTLQAGTDTVTFIRAEDGWVAKIETTTEVCGCMGPDRPVENWYRVMDEDEFTDQLDWWVEQSVVEIGQEVDDDDNEPEDKVQSMFEKGFTDGR